MTATVTVDVDSNGKQFTAESFLNALRPSNPSWWIHGEIHSAWVFRGQRNAIWPLLPSAWRSRSQGNPLHSLIDTFDALPTVNVISGEMQRLGINEIDSDHPVYSWLNAEHEALFQFSDLGNRLGLDVAPMDLSPLTQGYRLTGGLLFEAKSSNISIAQHHGVPTRYLDFTFNPVMAAYHAVSSSEADDPDSDIAVWALHRTAQAVFSDPDKNIGYHTLRFVESASIRNPYLQAQQGLFLDIIYGDHYFYFYKRWPDVESLLAETTQKKVVLKKYVLAADAVPDLKELLRREGFSKPRLMPTLDNVAAEIVNRWTRRG